MKVRARESSLQPQKICSIHYCSASQHQQGSISRQAATARSRCSILAATLRPPTLCETASAVLLATLFTGGLLHLGIGPSCNASDHGFSYQVCECGLDVTIFAAPKCISHTSGCSLMQHASTYQPQSVLTVVRHYLAHITWSSGSSFTAFS